MNLIPIKYPKALKRTATILEIVDGKVFYSYDNDVPFRTYPGKEIEYVFDGTIHKGKYDEVTSDDGTEIRLLLECESTDHLANGDTIVIFDTFQAKSDNDVVTLQDIVDQLRPKSQKIGLKEKKISLSSAGKPGLVSAAEKTKLDRQNIFVINDVDTPVDDTFKEIIALELNPNYIYEMQVKKGQQIFDGMLITLDNNIIISARHSSLDSDNNLTLKFVKHDFIIDGNDKSFVKIWAKIEPTDTIVNYRFGFGIPNLESLTFPSIVEEGHATMLFDVDKESIVLDRYLLSGDVNNINRIVTPDNLTAAATLDGEVTAMVAGSAIAVGHKFADKLSFSDYVRQVWTKIFTPTFINPSASLSVTGIASTAEAGTVADVTLTATFNQGQIRGKLVGGLWQATSEQAKRSGAVEKYVMNGNQPEVGQELVNTLVIPDFQLQDGNNVFNALVEYLQGPQPLNSQNQPFSTPLPEGDVSASRTLYGRRQAFYGTKTNTDPIDTSDKVRALTGKRMNPSNGTTFRIHIPVGTTLVAFAYDASLRDVTEVKYVQGLGADVKANFIKSNIPVAGLNNFNPRDYKVYIYKPVGPFDVAVDYDVTI